MVKNHRNPPWADRRFGQAFWQVIGLLATKKFKSKAELANQVVGDHGKLITRQRVRAIIATAVDAGILDKNPFRAMPQMARNPVEK